MPSIEKAISALRNRLRRACHRSISPELPDTLLPVTMVGSYPRPGWFTHQLAGRDILVNSVAPGFIDTEMTAELPEEVKTAILTRVPQQRMGTADEVADVVAFLATRASYVNGSVVHVNGGMFGG